MTVRRLRPIVAADLRSLGGTVNVVPVKDYEGREFFRVNHISRGRDLVWLSARIRDEGKAIAAAELLGEYLGAVVKR